MTILTHRPFEAKPVQPDSFALANYIESFEFQLVWRTCRLNLAQILFLDLREGKTRNHTGWYKFEDSCIVSSHCFF